ncbi:MAG: DUF2235 domain-containing protein, partial [Cytophagales bacterium]|nr:DUF2235 domain-containing protein [Rhizobacter sp.]
MSSAGLSPPLPRQIVVLCDGTNNNLTGGFKDTNVVKLAELLAAHPDSRRLVFYDPGVGNAQTLPGATTWDRIRRWGDRVRGLALGRGVFENMVESYLFLMRHYQPGDELYVLGFSRGAFTARSVAGLVNQFGLMAPQFEGMLPTLLNVYFSDRTGEENQKTVHSVAQQIRRQCVDRPAVDIHFVGVWDTVAAVGLGPVALKITALPTLKNKRFVHVRQALALDEHRAQFKPRLYAEPDGPFTTASHKTGSVEQRWFPGSHCDVGGGYENTRCHQSDIAFSWLVSEAVRCGLRLQNRAAQTLNSPALVAQALPQPHAPALNRNSACAHSELCSSPVWAVGGMAVRDTTRVVMDSGETKPLPDPQGDASVAALAGQQPNSVWASAKPGKLFWWALLGMPVFWLLHAHMLAQPDGIDPTAPGLAWDATLAFQRWHLAGAVEWLLHIGSPSAWPQSVGTALENHWRAFGGDFRAPRWALFWDFGLIASYAIVLA